ncbi:hypothetical protein BGX31_001089 [Mortierella sp. GBA43]|nr:hypothetical protein BGX31_001089 [Mortierella sp. GBA43]
MNQGKLTPAELKKMLNGYFLGITRGTFIAVWNKTIEVGLRYMNSSETPQDEPHDEPHDAACVGQDAQNDSVERGVEVFPEEFLELDNPFGLQWDVSVTFEDNVFE